MFSPKRLEHIVLASATDDNRVSPLAFATLRLLVPMFTGDQELQTTASKQTNLAA